MCVGEALCSSWLMPGLGLVNYMERAVGKRRCYESGESKGALSVLSGVTVRHGSGDVELQMS